MNDSNNKNSHSIELCILSLIILCGILYCSVEDARKRKDFLIVIVILSILLFIVFLVKQNVIEMYGGHEIHSAHGTREVGNGQYETHDDHNEFRGRVSSEANTTVNDGRNYTVRLGRPNPKTLLQPVMARRSHDLDVWKANGNVVHSHINDSISTDVTHYDNNLDLEEDGEGVTYVMPQGRSHPHEIPIGFTDGTLIEPYVEVPEHNARQLGVTHMYNDHSISRAGFVDVPTPGEAPEWKDNNQWTLASHRPTYYSTIDEDEDGIDDESYNNPEQLQYGLPSNLAVSDYEQDERFADDNRELHTQSIQPNIFSRHQVIEPINANMGISFNPQFQYVDAEGGGKPGIWGYSRIDPQLIRDGQNPLREMENPDRNRWTQKHSAWEAESGTVKQSDIYDPRHTGYGDPNRSYLDANTGQIRYYYSDIDAYRRPNFVIRSDVDHMDFQDPMGAVKPEYHRKVLSEHSRELTENQWMRDTLQHRENIMESLMRKRNQEMWQLRAAPISRGMTGRRSGR